MKGSSPHCESDPGGADGVGGRGSCGTGRAERGPLPCWRKGTWVAVDWGRSGQSVWGAVTEEGSAFVGRTEPTPQVDVQVWLREKESGSVADSWSAVWSYPSLAPSASDSSDTATPAPGNTNEKQKNSIGLFTDLNWKKKIK